MIADEQQGWEQLAQCLQQEVQQLWESLEEMPDAEHLEEAVREWQRRAGREVMGRLCQEAIVRREQAQIPVCCGKRMDHHSRQWRCVKTLLGDVRVRRRWYRCLECGATRYPADVWLGWKGGFSHPLQEAVAWECAGQPYREAVASLKKLAGVALSVHAAESIVARWGKAELPLQPQAQAVPTDLVVEVDGAMAHLKEGWKEMKLGSCFGWDRELPEAARTPEEISYVGDWLRAEQFAEPLWEEALRRGAVTARSVAVIGDGAAWVWELASRLFPRATQILDWYHLTEHLAGAVKVLHEEGTLPYGRLLEQWKTEVWEGRSEGVEEALRERVCEGRDDRQHTLRKCADYLQTHQHRIRYHLFRAMGWPVGSGVVEGGCKHVIGLRFKRASTRWTKEGGRAVLRLRLDRLNGRWQARSQHLRMAA